MDYPSENQDFEVQTEISAIGKCTVHSPLPYRSFTSEERRVVNNLDPMHLTKQIKAEKKIVSFEKAGAREYIYFDPTNLKVAIVTCGGICPGLNNVLRSIVHELHYMYGVSRIRGIQYGYAGLNPKNRLPMIELTPDTVRDIHEDGGSFLGSSRGPQPVDVMVDTLYREEIRILFVIGGDGSLRGAKEIFEEIKRRDLKISVIGVPKTIDNDISMVSRTFGFDTAVSAAVESLRCAHVEAKGAVNGIGIVKLMGRHSGFVAANAALALPDANFVLVPEVRFEFDGPNGLLAALERRVVEQGHALVVVAEGAGQELFGDELGFDESGNKKLGDIGKLLKNRIVDHFQHREIETSVKYIDPSYIIRSVSANSNDCIFCVFLGQHAVHAGMAGKTGMLVSSWNNLFIHLPIETAIHQRKQLQPNGILWQSVLETTGQPENLYNEEKH
jgi:6-phosphofructokinase 1